MKNKLVALFLATGLVLGASLIITTLNAYAVDSPPPITIDCAGDPNNPACKGSDDFDTIVANVLNTLSVFIFAVALIVMIFAGFRMTTSAGNPAAVQAAKNMIIYSIVGIVVVVLSYALVRFILRII